MPRLSEKLAQIRAHWDRLSVRERRLVSTLIGVVAALFVLGIGYYAWYRLTEMEDHNAAARQALKDIAQHREEFLEARQRMASQEVKVSRTPMNLGSLLESAAKEAGVQIAEAQDRPAAPRGKKYLEKGIDIKLRNLDLQSLTKFLRRIETGPNLVVVDRLFIKTRYNEHDKLESVEMGVMTFEQAASGKKGGEGSKT